MPDTPVRVKESDGALEISLHVQPRARKTEIAGEFNGALKLKVMAPPVDDAANKAVIQYFASLLSIPKSRIEITSGEKSREKKLRISGIRAAEFYKRLSLPPKKQ
jgi:uncharacterized protein